MNEHKLLEAIASNGERRSQITANWKPTTSFVLSLKGHLKVFKPLFGQFYAKITTKATDDSRQLRSGNTVFGNENNPLFASLH